VKQLQNIQYITKYTITISKGTITEDIHKLEDINIIAYSAWNRYDGSLSSWIYLLDPSLIPEYRSKILDGYKNGLINHKAAIMLNLEAIINFNK